MNIFFIKMNIFLSQKWIFSFYKNEHFYFIKMNTFFLIFPHFFFFFINAFVFLTNQPFQLISSSAKKQKKPSVWITLFLLINEQYNKLLHRYSCICYAMHGWVCLPCSKDGLMGTFCRPRSKSRFLYAKVGLLLK